MIDPAVTLLRFLSHDLTLISKESATFITVYPNAKVKELETSRSKTLTKYEYYNEPKQFYNFNKILLPNHDFFVIFSNEYNTCDSTPIVQLQVKNYDETN